MMGSPHDLFGTSDDNRGDDPVAETAELREYSPDEIADEILLSMVDGVGSLTAERLVTYFGTAEKVLNAPVDELTRVAKVGPALAHKIIEARGVYDVGALVAFCKENNITVLTPFDSRYPERLRQVDNPPRILYVRGEILPEDYHAIAIVGTRNATAYGRKQATKFASELAAAGFTIVSGLALGVDGCAHRAALDSGGRTIAALGGGVVRIFPHEHLDLAGRIVASNGALVSEYHPLTQPLRGNFPARNRIISGMAVAVLVIESGIRGGSLITARFAAEHNRELFVVPGPVDSEMSHGCHQLIREGGTLVESVDDILSALPEFEKPKKPKKSPDSELVAGTLGVSASSIASIDTKRKREVNEEKHESKKKNKQAEDKEPEEETPENQENSYGFHVKIGNRKARGIPVTRESGEELAPIPENLNEFETKLIDVIGVKRLSIDEVIRETQLPVSRVLGMIAVLEFKQVLRRLEGNYVERRRI